MVNVSKKDLEKIFSALIIPMNDDESINEEALASLVYRELQDGVEGFYVCGSSGEGLLLSLEERKRVLEVVMKEAGDRVPVIAHVGTIRTADAAELAKHAQQAGVCAVSMIPPYYYHFSMEEITRYYKDILAAVPGLPGIIYNIPQFTGIEFSKQNAGELLSDPDIIGVKHTSQNLYSLERMHDAYPDKVLFNGFDEQFIGAYQMGATAAIGTTVNLFAPLFLEARALLLAGDNEGAHRVQKQINERVELMVSVGIFNATKYLWTLRGVPCGNCRRPFKPLTEQQRKILEEAAQRWA